MHRLAIVPKQGALSSRGQCDSLEQDRDVPEPARTSLLRAWLAVRWLAGHNHHAGNKAARERERHANLPVDCRYHPDARSSERPLIHLASPRYPPDDESLPVEIRR